MLDPSVLSRVLDAALRSGGDFAEVFVEDRRSTGARLDDGRVEQVSSGRDRGAGIRVVVGDTTGFAHTADLTEAGLEGAARAAGAAARDGRGVTASVALRQRPTTSPSAVEVLPETVPKAAKVELLLRADAAGRAVGGAITQMTVGYGDSRRRIQVANSDGLVVSDDVVRTSLRVSAVAEGDTGMQTGYETVARTAGFELFDEVEVEAVARSASSRALSKLVARPAPTGVLPVVIKAGRGAVLFHEACGHGFEADAIEKRASVFTGKVGEQVASPMVTLVDDGTMAREWGASAIDDEGAPAARNVLIEDGRLTDYMWDFLRARKAGRRSSGNGRRQGYQHLPMVRMTNTYLLAGEDDPEELVRQTPYGVYVAQINGGEVNTVTGDFVFGMSEAYLIENGEITVPLRAANLIGNGPEVLRNIDAVANDFAMASGGGLCGKNGQSVPVGMGQPTLRVTGMTIGGTAA